MKKSIIAGIMFINKVRYVLKGEFVIVVEGNKDVVSFDDITIKEHVNMYMEDGLTEKEAIKKVAKERNMSKSDIYKEVKINN